MWRQHYRIGFLLCAVIFIFALTTEWNSKLDAVKKKDHIPLVHVDDDHEISQKTNKIHLEKTKTPVETALYLSDFLCYDKMNLTMLQKNSVDLSDCPTTGIVSAHQGGQTGNQIFEYSGVWVVAKMKNLSPFVPPCMIDELNKYFVGLSLPTVDRIANCPFPKSQIRDLSNWKNKNESIILNHYYQDISVILPYLSELLAEFKFRPELLAKADAIVHGALAKIYPDDKNNVTFVGVHVRRTSYEYHLHILRNASLVGPEFFIKAMDHFEKKYQKVLFLYTTDDLHWVRKHFANKTNAFIVSGNTSVGEDLALMSRGNHSIIDYGTFGIWMALFAGGETIVKAMREDEPSGQVPKYLKNWTAI